MQEQEGAETNTIWIRGKFGFPKGAERLNHSSNELDEGLIPHLLRMDGLFKSLNNGTGEIPRCHCGSRLKKVRAMNPNDSRGEEVWKIRYCPNGMCRSIHIVFRKKDQGALCLWLEATGLIHSSSEKPPILISDEDSPTHIRMGHTLLIFEANG